MHFAAVFVALCSGLCDLAGNTKQCMAATTSIVAIIAVLNVVPVVIALRWGADPWLKGPFSRRAPEQFGHSSSDKAGDNRAGTPLSARTLHTQVIRPLRSLLKLETYRDSAYTVVRTMDHSLDNDLPVLVRLRRDGAPDLPALTVPADIQACSTFKTVPWSS